jgi:hypothetical protein
MKAVLFMILFMLTVSCGTVITVDTHNDFRMTVVTDSGKEIDMTCHLGLTSDKGIVLDSECVGYFQDGNNTYRCTVKVTSDKLPVTKRIAVSENCTIIVAK